MGGNGEKIETGPRILVQEHFLASCNMSPAPAGDHSAAAHIWVTSSFRHSDNNLVRGGAGIVLELELTRAN